MTRNHLPPARNLLEELVACDSRNPDISVDGPGELAVARLVAEHLAKVGISSELVATLGERPNLFATVPGRGSTATVIFCTHLDTVDGSAETRALRWEGDRLHGRGAVDAKASLVAMMLAMERLAQADVRPTILLAATCDEEYRMRGAVALAAELPAADAVIIGEPTSLVPKRAGNGMLRFDILVEGVAAHSSNADLGRNAIEHAARLVADLDDSIGAARRELRHPLTGRALLSPTMISGGTAPNVIPDACLVTYDRRLSPDEDPMTVHREIADTVTAAAERLGISARALEPGAALAGLETDEETVVVRASIAASEAVLGERVQAGGVSYSTDASAFRSRDDLPAVILGPGSIDTAHSIDEWVDVDEVERGVEVYVAVVENVHALTRGPA